MGCFAMLRLKLDDPVGAIPVHAANGLFGVLAVSLCRPSCEYMMHRGGLFGAQLRFCSGEHSPGKQLLAQLWGAFTFSG